jgi:hypothetical protein
MWLLAEIDKPNLLFLLGVVLASSILLLRSLRRTRRSSSASLPQTPSAARGASAASSLQALPELQRWEVQMHETARELTARIDNKLRLLEQLIRDADERIARLETLEGGTNQTEMAEDDSVIPLSQLSQLVGSPASTSEGETAASDMPQRPAKAPGASQRSEEIYALADAGRDSAEIARQLNSPVGEVELILGLRERR